MAKVRKTAKKVAAKKQTVEVEATAKVDEKKKAPELHKVVVIGNDYKMLRAVCDKIVGKKAGEKLSESEMTVASAAVNLETWSEFVDRKQMIDDVNGTCSFGAYHYRTAKEDREGEFNLVRGAHRDISANYGCKLGKKTGVFEAEVSQTKVISTSNYSEPKKANRTAKVRIAKGAAKVLAEYKEQIEAVVAIKK